MHERVMGMKSIKKEKKVQENLGVKKKQTFNARVLESRAKKNATFSNERFFGKIGRSV